MDDHYEHALRVYRDRDSGAIRLQASVKDGELKRYRPFPFTHLILAPLCCVAIPDHPFRFPSNLYYFHVGRTPVWTAFITHNVCSSRWMHRFGSKTIHLADLQRYVFSSEYVPQLGPGGEHELVFKKIEGTLHGVGSIYV